MSELKNKPKKSRKPGNHFSMQTKEAKLADLAEEFRRVESKGEGLKEDIKLGQVAWRIEGILKERRELCTFVSDVLGTNMMRLQRVKARARAEELVPFNDLLKIPKTAIDILASKNVPDGAIKEAVRRQKQGERITEAVAKEITDRRLEAAGIKRRKRKTRAKPGEEVPLKNTRQALARHLGTNFSPEEIRRIADGATVQARRNGSTSGRNAPSLLEAIRWLKPALPNETAKDAGVATDYVLIREGHISAYSGSLLARAPCAQDGTFVLDPNILEMGLERYEEQHFEEDPIRFWNDPDTDYLEIKSASIEEFCPQNQGLIDRHLKGERHPVTATTSIALVELWRLQSRMPGKPVDRGAWLFDGAALVVTPLIVACVRTGVRPSMPLWVPQEAIRFLMKKPVGPEELFIEPDLFWMRWADSAHIAVEREEPPEGAHDAVVEALALIEAHSDPAVRVRFERPTEFERANGIAAMSVLVEVDRLCANDASSSGPSDRNPRPGAAFDFNGYSRLLPFQFGNVVGLVGLSKGSGAEDEAATA